VTELLPQEKVLPERPTETTRPSSNQRSVMLDVLQVSKTNSRSASLE
jgi:hypothetical protein